MSPLAKSLLAITQATLPITSEEVEQAFGDALLCSDEPGSLTAEPFVARIDGQPVAGVRAQLHDLEWTLSGKLVRAVMRRLQTNRDPRIAQRQGLRLAAETLDRVSKLAAVQVYVARARGAH